MLSPAPPAEGPAARGFYTAREVRAPSAAAASLRAMALVQEDPRVAVIMDEWRSAAPELSIDEVVVMESGEAFDEGPKGFIFYDESADDADEAVQ